MPPLVSILLPTRKRPQWLIETIDSLWSLAHNKDCLEFLLKIDDDDKETIAVARQLSSMTNLRTLISPRGEGYRDMHLWINSLCAMSTGEWLFIFNDDARMKTQNWDRVLLGNSNSPLPCDEIIGLIARVISRPNSHEFIFIKRKVYDILGHWALNPHNDTWILSVLTMIQSVMHAEIYIEHFNDSCDDIVAQERKIACAKTIYELNSSKMIRAKIADAVKLMDYIDSHDISSSPPTQER